MRAEGNGEASVCLQNLLATQKTECPLSRDKGIDARLIDSPASGMEELDEDITNLINDYESRLDAQDLDWDFDGEGDFSVTVRVKPKEGDNNGV